MNHPGLNEKNEEESWKEKTMQWDRPLLSVDIVVFTLKQKRIKVLMLKREEEPEKNKWALPGVLVNPQKDDSLESSAMRALAEKVQIEEAYLEQLSHFSGKTRDPRGWSSTQAFISLVHESRVVESSHLEWVDIDQLDQKDLAFDHHLIIRSGLERLQNKVNYSSLPAYLLEKTFTLSELMEVYELILGQSLDKSSFRKKMKEMNVVCPVKDLFKKGCNRPAQMFTINHRLTLFKRNLTYRA